jgi:glycosyltransferase involved in cell wall biosynthesis
MDCDAEVIYNIYGPVKDNEYWNKCKSVISRLPKNISVYYHGELSPDLIPGVLANSHVIIQPSKSENFGHSLYEALTSGLPIITSHYTPWNQLSEENAGYNVSIDTHGEIREAIAFFAAMEDEQFEQWSYSARQYALKAIDVEDIRKKYLGMFNNEQTISSPEFEHKKGTISYI